MRLCTCFLFTIVVANVFAQANKPIRHLESTHQIEFRASDNKVTKVLDVINNNRYARLNYQASTTSAGVAYRLKPGEKTSVLNSFFLKKKEGMEQLNPQGLKATSDVLISENHVVIADHLTMYGGGILGVKSVATVFDKTGTKIATLPENNDGYYAPVVTGDGKYLATTYGDFITDVDFTLLPFPGFRIYDLRSNSIVFERQASSDFDVYPPSSRLNMIIEVLAHRGSLYEYLFILPGQRIIYSRKFTADEVGRFADFTQEGVKIKENGKERHIRFDKEFTRESF
jgi:hypothetical protein